MKYSIPPTLISSFVTDGGSTLIIGAAFATGSIYFALNEISFSDTGESGIGVASDNVFKTSTTSKIIFVGWSDFRERGLFFRFGD